ncbi:histidinol dehydrogenase [Desulfovibrio sp. OttesenSCG-928-M14]|nr:histidinol dehydrogenase [Desulfovibrio sp. OttesenSCG-928-M14]
MGICILYNQDKTGLEDFFVRLRKRGDPGANSAETENTVRAILADVRQRGLEAVVDYSRRFDAPEFTADQFTVSEDQLEEASKRVPLADKDCIRRAADNIRAFHEAQKSSSWFRALPDGSLLGQAVIPMERAGLYVPGGKGGATPLLSSLLMNAVPAQVAGVGQLAVISPPQADGRVNDHILAAAHILGITEVYAAGSAWAVAALAYGAGPLRPVDVITGPGNIFVATAKRLLIGVVGIDMIAGPSEICIVADETANPAWVAADLLGQAEHDALASCVCIASDQEFAKKCALELEKQLATLPRRDIAAASLASYSAIIVEPKLSAALALVNRIAPEHLELMIADPWAALPAIRHAGAIFMGSASAEALGDYFAGPNHVLPTMGTARFSSALSVDNFCKRSSIIAASPAFAAAHAEDVARLARLEGLEAHARSALCREQGAKNSPD